MQAQRTPDGFHLVFGHPETHCWQLVDVPTFFDLPQGYFILSQKGEKRQEKGPVLRE
jgi:hypothetical protein